MYVIFTAFVLSILFNLFIILFGTKDVEAMKAKLSVGGSYLKEVNRALAEAIGDQGATVIKLILSVAAILFLILHLVTAILCLLAIALGTWTAKRLYKIPSASGFLNRLATYVNRLR